MARRRFFVPEIRRNSAELTGPEAEHLVRVLRVEAGQIFEISDNHSVYLAEVETARKSLVTFATREQLALAAPQPEIHLYAALFKFDHFEMLVEKATELGVSQIHPVQATRSEPGLAQASVKRHGRWEKIALEASQQSRRDHLPQIGTTLAFKQALEQSHTARFFLDEARDTQPLLSSLPPVRAVTDTIAVLLGPEGGWTDPERDSARTAGWTFAGLGRNILRAETAGIAALAILRAAWQTESSTLDKG